MPHVLHFPAITGVVDVGQGPRQEVGKGSTIFRLGLNTVPGRSVEESRNVILHLIRRNHTQIL